MENNNLLTVVKTLFPECSGNKLKKIISSGRITVNNEICRQAARIIAPDEKISVLSRSFRRHAIDENVIIEYEDNDLLIINKPSGLLSVPDNSGLKSARDICAVYLASVRKHKNLYIVHRLDRDASGLMLFAKNHNTQKALIALFTGHFIMRQYTAWVEGSLEQENGKIDTYIFKDENTFRVSVCGAEKEGAKRAITGYHVLACKNNFSLCEITLETGRKNQIRVHMAHIGHAVCGDRMYGSKSSYRLLLHAHRLFFRHPVNGKMLDIKSALPDDFVNP